LLKVKDISNILKDLNYYKNIIFMHSISRYPTKKNDLNLNSIGFLKKFLMGYQVGFSDHTKDDDAILTSISKGSTYIEKHFTYDKSRSGFDHSISYDFKEMRKLIKKIEKLEKSFGKNVYLDDKFQIKERKAFLRYAVAKKNINKSSDLELENIKFMRVKNSKNAIEPINIKKFLKKKLRKKISINQPIRFDDFKK
jgi:sialic acid synthase SpsE